ncbi:endonuclease MutS2 [Spirulina subsalsa FACHB-351]|uniref:Endonuclease MutS2 n=1 Tax=Spirulina subsalsa FACHB-351 TaxID=234711 RepID=A0ABT3L3D9_9CYAN|nr:endonuclease MutS2 [Spirulina subsalsa]MCW6035500.1 endonuclease MutS2 [Spirulina subsalsa FACHB-351]
MIQAETLELLEWSRLCQHLATFAATKLGAIAARHLQLPSNRAETVALLEQTKEAYLLESRTTTGLSFEGIQDIGDSLERAERQGILSGKALLDIATTLAGMRRLRRMLDEQEEVPTLQSLVSEIRTYPELEQHIHHCIDERGEVADRASAKLADLRQQLKTVRDRIYHSLNKIIQRQTTSLQQMVITQRGDRFVLAVKASHKDTIPGIVHDTSSTGVTFYIEPYAIVETGNKLRQLQRQEQREQEAILQALTLNVAEVQADLEHLLATATKLDLATAKARYSLWLEGNPPRFIESGEGITLRQLRHPLLVWQHKHEQGSAVIPIDVQVNPKTRVVAITGPNTGGKTVTLKTIGLAALMAKVGLFLPAREPVELPWFEHILADIGDEQSLEQSLSTFSGHIRRISRILDAIQTPEATITPDLILLDEVGAGTDPAEGSALAIALLQYLAAHVHLTIATTHYGELKALKYQDERFENASVEFDEASLSPTYRLLWGIPGRSNALSIAQRLGLPPAILSLAQERVGGLSQDVNEVIAGLEAQRKRQEDKADAAAQLLAEAERFYQEVSQRAQSLQEREQALKQSQEQAVQTAIAQAKAEIAQVIRELQQQPKTGQNAQKATQALQHVAQRHLPAPRAKKKPSYLPKIGERVRVPRLGQTAEVLSLSDNQEELSVRFGLMKMTIPITDIESLDGKKVELPPKEPRKTPTVSITPPAKPPVAIRTSSNTLDIRGKRVHQVESDLEQAINKATQSGILWVIHGKGTGKLREGVHEWLTRHPQVERFELAPQNEGGSGVTIAYLI